jgi:cbb3-type cytochrome c oxidase subunit III
MKRILFAVLAVSLAGAALAADGSAIYAAKCVACHGKDGKGTAVGQKMGAHDLTALKEGETEIVATITNGDGKMPAFKQKLSTEEIQAVAKFVKGGLK